MARRGMVWTVCAIEDGSGRVEDKRLMGLNQH